MHYPIIRVSFKDQTPLYRKIWAHVVYDALNKIIHSKDAEVVAQLGVALLRTLPVVEERDPNTFCDKVIFYLGQLIKYN